MAVSHIARAFSLLILFLLASVGAVAQPLVGSAPGAAGRKLQQMMPDYTTPDDFKAPGTARRRPAMVRINDGSTALEIQPHYFLDVTVSCTSGSNQVTITPGVFPDAANFSPGTTWQAKIPQCAAGGALLTANVSTISVAGASQTIALNAVNAGNTFNGVVRVAIGPQGGGPAAPTPADRASHNAAYYVASGITFDAGSRTLTVPANTFGPQDVTEVGPTAFYATDISIPNARGAGCTEPLVTAIMALPSGTTATLRDAPGCSATNATGWLHYGPLVFGPADVGRHVEMQTGANDLVTTIASVTDPLHVVLANPNSGAKTNKTMAEITVGPDATAAFTTAVTDAATAGQRYLYLPAGKAYFLPTATAATMEYAAALAWCGPGDVYLPASLKLGKAVSRNCVNPPPVPWPGNTLIPDLHLRTARAAVGPVKIIVLGDSQATRIYNDMAATGFPDVLCSAIQRKNPGLSIDCRENMAIGGTTWHAFDPAGPDLGQGVGRPATAPASLPTWYSPTGNQYYTFVQAKCPHVLVVKWGFNDGYTITPSAVRAFFNVTQGTAWRTACGFNPDVILVTEGGPGQAVQGGYTSPDPRRYAADFVRSLSLTCAIRLANGGCPGLVDLGRARDLAGYGWSTQDLIPERAPDVVPSASPNNGPTITTTSFTWPSWTMDYGGTISTARVTAANPAAWWSTVGTIRFSLGAGAAGQPTNTTGNNGLTLAPDGGEFVLGYAVGTGNYTVRVSIYDVTVTATATSSGSTVTCAAACTNMAFDEGGSIDIPGAGAAGATLTTTVTSISADGRTITLADPVITPFTSASKALRFYWDLIPTTDTGVTARCTVVLTFCEAGFVFQRQGAYFRIYDGGCFSCGPIWSGPVVVFGGFHKPKITFGAISTWRFQTTATTNVPRVVRGRPDSTPYAVTATDTEMWGNKPSGAGRYAGGNWVHPSTFEAVLDRVLEEVDWNLDVGGQRSAEVTPVTGFSYAVPANQTLTLFTPAGTLASGTVTLPAGIAENQPVQITSTQAITSLTIVAPTGLTLVGATATTIPANGTLTWRRAGNKLVRVQ